ncbi:MAG: Gfo/Idh/MocA family oxidoreductase [Cyclobacteriaceae bacterium]|nr:Gfo/Idh/MocA family oxidoreductase [Cyclobacteriaceae bacterium]
MKDEVRWGIIGCGDVCEVKSGPAFSKVGNSRLVAVMRRNEAKAKDYAQRHHVGKFYKDAQTLINDPEVNAVYIATPPAQHEEYAIKSMLAGKPVYIEKPLALNAESCISIRDTSLALQVPSTGAYYRRALPLFNKVKSLLAENRIGTVKLVLLRTLQSPTKNTITKTPDNWRVNPEQSGGGLFHDLAPHQLDLMYWFFGKPTEMKGRSLNQDKINSAPDVTSFEALFNDVFLRGIWAFNVHESAVADTCEIIGDKGMLKFPFFTRATLEIKTDNGIERIDFTNPPHIQQPMIEKVVQYFRGECENPCSVDDALVSMRMLDSTLEN